MKPQVNASTSTRVGSRATSSKIASVPASGKLAEAVDVRDLVSLSDFEPLAQRRMSHMTWEYFESGVADEVTLRENREAFDRLRLRPKVLIDVSDIDTRINLFGEELEHPILLAPAADQRMLHSEGELATVRGAAATHSPFVVSSLTNTAIEDIAKETQGPLWFQLYVQRDRGFTREVCQRVEAAGCKALCVTVDTPVFGARNRQERAKYTLAPGLSRPHVPPATKAVGSGDLKVFSDFVEPALTWRDIGWLTSIMRIPVVLKGILNPDDADLAVQSGVAGIIVSNHGARNLDTVPASADALPRVAEKVGGRIPVLVDGGIRRGTDVVKALALGANAVLIGRPYLYALSVGGEQGVRRVIDILRTELEMAMGLLGRPTVHSIDSSIIWR